MDLIIFFWNSSKFNSPRCQEIIPIVLYQAPNSSIRLFPLLARENGRAILWISFCEHQCSQSSTLLRHIALLNSLLKDFTKVKCRQVCWLFILSCGLLLKDLNIIKASGVREISGTLLIKPKYVSLSLRDETCL